MNINKLAPWNWFKKEEESDARMVPVRNRELHRRISHPILEIHKQVDQLFDEFFKGFGLPDMGFGKESLLPAQEGFLKPTLDISATDKEYTIAVELPGVDEKNVALEVINDTLIIKGEKKQEKEEKDKNFYRVERSYGSFQRVLSLPEDADQEHINASYKNGVISITIPRIASSENPDVKKIEIKSA